MRALETHNLCPIPSYSPLPIPCLDIFGTAESGPDGASAVNDINMMQLLLSKVGTQVKHF